MPKATKAAPVAFLDLDQTIEALTRLRASGVAGTTPVTYPTTDNNLSPGFMQRVESIAVSTVAKADFERGYGICKAGTRGGVPVVAIR